MEDKVKIFTLRLALETIASKNASNGDSEKLLRDINDIATYNLKKLSIDAPQRVCNRTGNYGGYQPGVGKINYPLYINGQWINPTKKNRY